MADLFFSLVVLIFFSQTWLHFAIFLVKEDTNIHYEHISLKWQHNERDGVINHRRLDCLLNHLFRRRSKKTTKLGVTVLCEANSPGNYEFPAQKASVAERISFDDVIMSTMDAEDQATQHYSDVIMSAMASEITNRRLDCLLNRLFGGSLYHSGFSGSVYTAWHR